METPVADEDEANLARPRFAPVDCIRSVDIEGDLCLAFSNRSPSSPFRFQVSTRKLQQASPYFKTILDPDRFQEGVALVQAAHHLEKRINTVSDSNVSNGDRIAHALLLPVLYIEDVDMPNISASEDVLCCFLRYLHGHRQHEWLVKQPFRFLFALACVADRFMSHEYFQPAMQAVHEARQQGLRKSNVHLERVSLEQETAWRQRIIMGLWYNFEDWVQHYTHLLILYGSQYWASETPFPEGQSLTHGLWSEIPEGIEGKTDFDENIQANNQADELRERRNLILSSIASLQNEVINGLVGGSHQCRLGYDSSPQCNDFQLGQCTRFLRRKNLINLQSTVAGIEEQSCSAASISAICAVLRSFPRYQINSHHAHCGPRPFLMPRIQRIEAMASMPQCVGLCISCWRRPGRNAHRWTVAVPGLWRYRALQRDQSAKHHREGAHAAHHVDRVSLFTAQRWSWVDNDEA